MAITLEMTLDCLKKANVVLQVQILEVLPSEEAESNAILWVKVLKKIEESNIEIGDQLKFIIPIWTPKNPPSGHKYFNLSEVKKDQLLEAFLVCKNPDEFQFLDGMFLQQVSDHSQYRLFLKTEIEQRPHGHTGSTDILSRIKMLIFGSK